MARWLIKVITNGGWLARKAGTKKRGKTMTVVFVSFLPWSYIASTLNLLLNYFYYYDCVSLRSASLFNFTQRSPVSDCQIKRHTLLKLLLVRRQCELGGEASGVGGVWVEVLLEIGECGK